ncbi:MAG: DUF1616 domain-containing protein [Methanoregula sp.]|nr:DUF1616 domain-containing protein [Methanoregula sp.]
MDSGRSSDTVLDTFTRILYRDSVPNDLKIVWCWLFLTIIGIYLPPVNQTFLRILFGLPMVLFIPGYTLIAALFPGSKDIDGIERIALSFGLSIAVVPLIGLALNYTPWGIRLDPIVVCLTSFTLCMSFAALYRRMQLPPEERFTVPFRALQQSITAEFLPKTETSRLDRVLSIILLIAIIAAVATTVYVIVVPKEGEKFTEFFILGAKQKATDYPTNLVTGQNSSLYIGIGNHEYRNITYNVETYFMQMTFNETDNTSTLNAMTPVSWFTVPVAHNQTVITPYPFTPETTGYNRLEFLLFNETVPGAQVQGMDRINQSYRDLHLWVTIKSR